MQRVYLILFTLFLLGISQKASACPEGVDKLIRVVENEMDPGAGRAASTGHVAGTHLPGQEATLVAQDGRAAQLAMSSDEARDTAMAAAHESSIAAQAGAVNAADEGEALIDVASEAALIEREVNAGQSAMLPDGAGITLNAADDLADTQRVQRIMNDPARRAEIRNDRTARRFKALYKESNLEFDNRLFIKGIDEVPPGKKAVYFDVENSMLKQLNDEILETKDYSDAVTNFFNKTLWERIQADPVLRTKLEGRYRDFKSMRFRFLIDEGEDATLLMNRLKQAYGEAASKFGDFMGKTGLEELWKGRPGQAGKPEKWFLAGVGETPLEANMAARQARGLVDDFGSSNRLVEYRNRVDNLATDIKGIESIRGALSNTPSLKKAGIMTDPGNGKPVLDKDAIGILRKTKRGDFTDLDKYRASVREQFKKLYGTDVDDFSIDAMTRYFEGVDSLSPPLFIRSRNGIDLSQADNGLVSVDFTGVGVDNAFEAMVGLTKTAEDTGSNSRIVGRALSSVDEHVDNVTESMNASKRAFNEGTQDVTQQSKPAIFSGDDGMYFPDKAWTRPEKQKLVDQLAQGDPSKYRVTFVETSYKNGDVIPGAARSEMIVRAEKVEKAIRKMVTGTGPGQISPERAREMMIAIEYKPALKGKSDWDILFGGKLDHTEQTVLRRAMETVIEKLD